MEKFVTIDAREVQRSLFHYGLHAGQKTRCLALPYELFASPAQLRSNAILQPKQRAKIAGKATFPDHFLEQIAQQRRIEAAGKFIDQRGIARHRLGDNDVCPLNARTFGGLELQGPSMHAVPAARAPRPRSARTWIDVHTI